MSANSAALRHPPSADETTAGTLLALGVHGLLVAALALGVNWRSHEATPLSAELWAAVPRVAAPEAAPPPPPPPPEVAKPKVEAPPPAPPPKAVEPEAQIVTETKPVAKPVPDEKLAEKQAEEKAQAREAERRKKDEARKKEEARKQEEARVERQRKENLDRLAAQLPGSAPTPSPGTDTQSAGPSASYTGRVRARIFPNILFTDVVPSRGVAEVQVSVAPDGKITGRKLTRSSGAPAWDEAVLRAIDRTEQLPLDEGRAPPASMLIEFDPNKR